VLVLGLAVSGGAASAQAGGLDLRFGGYFPSADSNLFDDDADLYTRGAAFGAATPPGLKDSDWDGFAGGIEYNHKLAHNVEWAVHVDGYGRTLDTSYRHYTRTDGSPILQTLKLEIVPIGASIRIVPTSRRARFAPFLAVGADLVYYKYREFGDFIDFFDPDRPIIADSFRSDGFAPGFHAAGGFRIALGDDFAIVGEGRYLWSKTDMDDDFRNNRIDLGGISATLGMHIRF
jgi:hypothetical protein